MAQVRITGEVPNLRMLLEDLESSPEFSANASAELKRLERDRHRLEGAELASLLIDLAVSVGASGLYDLLKYAVRKARQRGPLTVEGLDEEEPREQHLQPGVEPLPGQQAQANPTESEA